jgi:hypothetical protein
MREKFEYLTDYTDTELEEALIRVNYNEIRALIYLSTKEFKPNWTAFATEVIDTFYDSGVRMRRVIIPMGLSEGSLRILLLREFADIHPDLDVIIQGHIEKNQDGTFQIDMRDSINEKKIRIEGYIPPQLEQFVQDLLEINNIKAEFKKPELEKNTTKRRKRK